MLHAVVYYVSASEFLKTCAMIILLLIEAEIFH